MPLPRRFRNVLLILTLLTASSAYAADQASVDRTPDLAGVVSAAESYTGEPAIQAVLENRAGALFYRVRTAGPADGLVVKVDPRNGNILGVRPDFMIRWVHEKLFKPADPKGDPMGGLASAIRKVQSVTGGSVLAAQYDRLPNKTDVYRMRVLKGGKLMQFTVNARTGELLGQQST